MNASQNKRFLDELQNSSLSGANADYIEYWYEQYQQHPQQVPEHWRRVFANLIAQSKVTQEQEVPLSMVREDFKRLMSSPRTQAVVVPLVADPQAMVSNKQVRVLQLINAYRILGHMAAHTNPLKTKQTTEVYDLKLDSHGLTEADLDTEFNSGSLVCSERASLRKILEILNSTYCGSVGAEYMHITDTTEKRWVQNYMESTHGKPDFNPEQKKRILTDLIAAEGLERYLHSKYIGQKRFSLEGAESLIPLLNETISRTGMQGVEELVVGMAHRGRLNVLVNVLGKTPAELFLEFEGKANGGIAGTGDVKYHLGFSSDLLTPGGPVHVALAFNPSHLEIGNPVVEGSVRARQQRRNDHLGNKVVPILIHGDAAFAGQGVVMETFNMSQSRGFSTKGSVHIVINNQIGFTTSNQADARSTLYCTDVAKMVAAPIFHVNGDDPEAVIFVCQMAVDYRMTFFKDVVIDLVCYRRHGHSEADEPSATQPLMYRAIRRKPTTLEVYAGQLHQQMIMSAEETELVGEAYRQKLNAGTCVVENVIPAEQARYPYDEDWTPFQLRACSINVDTGVHRDLLQKLYTKLARLPKDFKLHMNVEKIMQSRKHMADGELALDWGFAETMAYATLLNEGYAVRLSGQDCGRGTFFHRHAVLHNQDTGRVYVPLRNLAKEQANFLVINSLLSEEAVLAFEYGYATTDPNTLTIWEAQFGDFANNAQVVIDQFIVAGEQKWNRMCGLVMLLPHGFEGQGPEHSSARLERFLQLCAQQNIQVCVPTNAAQIFHLLRRQMLQSCRRPLIVMTPKSLLRHKDAASLLTDITHGEFRRVIPPPDSLDRQKVQRVVLCSGKVYYEIINRIQKDNRTDVAVIRIEQLYPYPEKELRSLLETFPNVAHYSWCQEEPKNQGAWYTTRHHLRAAIGKRKSLHYAGRPNLAAPAVGLYSLHTQQLDQLLTSALGSL